MKRLINSLLLFSFILFSLIKPAPTKAQEAGLTNIMAGSIGLAITGTQAPDPEKADEYCGPLSSKSTMNLEKYLAPSCNEQGEITGLLPTNSRYLAMLYQQQPSSREYIADLLDNIGIPKISSAYAQGTGYQALSPILSFWKTFRNLAYSLYIIMFVVVGIMIMLRTKVNQQTIITIQSALPNLIITLLLITFSYAIVGFLIDLMYFLIYAIVYLVSSSGIISTPTKAISRLMSYSAWGVIFQGRNSIISAVTLALKNILSGFNLFSMGARIGVGMIGGLSEIVANGIFYLFTAVWVGFAMLKLSFILFKSYIMLIIQTITAPLQILMNALPGSKAFSNWLKKTASYLIPFPVAASMFILAAVFIGNPTQATIVNFGGGEWGRDANPFGINQNHDFYQSQDQKLWLPPFTFGADTTNNWKTKDLLVIIGFFIFTMTPATVKMAQEWLQVKESPYIAEGFAGAKTTWGLGTWAWGIKRGYENLNLRQQQLQYYQQASQFAQQKKH